MKVRYMLEYMALCGDPTLSDRGTMDAGIFPEPSGVPTGIVVMPDFVIDIHAPLLEERSPGPVCPAGVQAVDVGSRAGRLAWVLHALGGRDDGLCNTSYVTEAGHLGREVLLNRFQRVPQQTMTHPMPLRYVFPSQADDWVAVYDPRSCPGRREPRVAESDSLESNLLADMVGRPYSLKHLFSETRYIVVASKYAGRVEEAFEIIRAGLKEVEPRTKALREHLRDAGRTPKAPHIGILLDLSALANDEDGPEVLGKFAELSEELGSAYAMHTTVLYRWEQRSRVDPLRSRFTNVLLRRRHTAAMLDEGKWIHVRGDSSALNLSSPMTREAFTAGYVIATTCDLSWRTLDLWHWYLQRPRDGDDEPHLGVRFRDDLPEDDRRRDPTYPLPGLGRDTLALTPQERLATAVGGAAVTDTYPLTYYELIQVLSRKRGLPSIEPAWEWAANPQVPEVYRRELDCARSPSDKGLAVGSSLMC